MYVADSSKVTQRKVTLGTQVGRDIIIKQGLTTGEIIVTEGVQNLREGSAINIAQPNNGQPSGPAAAATRN